jgi:hypothetical protein
MSRKVLLIDLRPVLIESVPKFLAALVVAGWPDLNTLSVRLVITTAILFGFLTAVFAEVLPKQGRIDQVEEDDHRRSRDQDPARH